MVAFFLTGGVGDAILSTAVIKELSALYGPLLALNFNRLAQQVLEGQPGIAEVRHMAAHECRSMAKIAAACPEAEMVVFNKFRVDHQGRLNFFCPLSESMHAEAESRRGMYMEALRRQARVTASGIEQIDTYRLLTFFNSEQSYFADWNRYGIMASYENVGLIPVAGKPSRVSKIPNLGRYAIVHDSKFPDVTGKTTYVTKAWYGPRWSVLCRRLKSELGMDNIVQMCGLDQALFDSSAVKSEDVLGVGAEFWDYLELVRRSALYVGTDSWPGHAAILLKEKPAFVILKGAVSRRWAPRREIRHHHTKGPVPGVRGAVGLYGHLHLGERSPYLHERHHRRRRGGGRAGGLGGEEGLKQIDLGTHLMWVEDGSSEKGVHDYLAAAVQDDPGVGLLVPSSYTVGTKRMAPLLQASPHAGAGRGLPVPDWAAAFRKGLVEPERCLVADDRASMLRLAVALADKGVAADEKALDAAGVPPKARLDALRGSPCWRSEVNRQEGRLRLHNSTFLAKRAAAADQFCLESADAFRPLLVSGKLSWGTKAVFDGYLGALQLLGVKAAAFHFDEHLRSFSSEVTCRLLLGEIADRTKGYTHLVFTDGLSIPPWLLRSTDLPKVLVSTEDPHSLDITRILYPYYDHVFTNDLNAADLLGLSYLPVAADHLLVNQMGGPIPEEWWSDVLFLGAVYSCRVPWLERAAAICGKLGAKLRVVGTAPAGRPPRSLEKVWSERVVTTRESLLLHAGAKVCLNFFRDATDPSEKNGELKVRGTSVNPRCYDAAACGSSLLTDFRPEALAVFGKECVVDEGSLAGAIEKNLEDGQYRKEKTASQMNTVLGGHLYIHRAMVLLATIGQGFFRRGTK